MNVDNFALGTERMIDPIEIGKAHYMQTKLSKLPVCIQRKIVTSATKKATKMPFIVEPYAFFLFYEISDPTKIEKFMPGNFAPAKSSIFAGDTPKYYGIVSMVRLHTSVFWGARAEFYLVAENKATGLLSWVMMDYISDTISYDEKHGLKSPDVRHAVLTTTCEGKFLAEMKTTDGAKSLECEAIIKDAKMRPLDQKLWIEGNTSIAYGRLAGEADGDLFSLTFMPEEMTEALEIPLTNVIKAHAKTTEKRTGGILERAVCFPYAQHMLSDAPGQMTHYGSEAALRKAAEAVDFRKLHALAVKK